MAAILLMSVSIL